MKIKEEQGVFVVYQKKSNGTLGIVKRFLRKQDAEAFTGTTTAGQQEPPAEQGIEGSKSIK